MLGAGKTLKGVGQDTPEQNWEELGFGRTSTEMIFVASWYTAKI